MDGDNRRSALATLMFKGEPVDVSIEPDEDGLYTLTYQFMFDDAMNLLVFGSRMKFMLHKGLRLPVGERFTVSGKYGTLGFEVMEDIKSKEKVRAKLIYEDTGG